jgi:hypothetical protein
VPTVTVSLRKSADRPAEVRRGATVYTLAPGEAAEVPVRVAELMVEQGATIKKSRSTSDEAGGDS